jgi:hypothetical protein
MKLIQFYTLIVTLLLSSQAFSADEKKAKSNSLFCPESVNMSTKSDNQCLLASVVSATVIYNLASKGMNYTNKDYDGPKYSSIKTGYEAVCIGKVADSTWQKLHSLEEMDANARKNAVTDPNGFVGAAWEQYKERVSKKKWTSDILPKIASDGYKKVTAGKSIEIMSGFVEHATKERLENKYVKDKDFDENSEDFTKMNIDLFCESSIQKLVEKNAFNKPGMLGSVLKIANSANDISGSLENKLFYADIVTKIALDGSDKASQFYSQTITPLIKNSKKWTNTQKIKAGKIKGKLKDFFSNKKANLTEKGTDVANNIKDIKDATSSGIENTKERAGEVASNGLDTLANAKDKVANTTIKLKDNVLISIKNIEDKIIGINKEFNSIQINMIDIIKDGEHFPLESNMRRYTEFLRAQLIKMRIDHAERVQALKDKIHHLSNPKEPDDCPIEEENESTSPDNDDNSEYSCNEEPVKVSKIGKAKEKVKVFFGKIQNKFKNKERSP